MRRRARAAREWFDFGRISEYYLEERYPPLLAISPSAEEMEASLHVLEQLVQHIEQTVGPA